MSFGKRRTVKGTGEPPDLRGLQNPPAHPAFAPERLNTAGISRLLVISVAGIVMLAAISALFYIQPGRGEPIEIEASLIDGSQVSASAHSRVVQMCIEHGMLSATRGGGPGEGQRARITTSCECTVTSVVNQLSALQMQMLYVDYRTALRATIAEIDRTGDRVTVGSMPKLEMSEGAPVALVTSASYASHWREARGLVSLHTARCRS